MMGMTGAQTTTPALLPVGTTIEVHGQISCAGYGSSGGVGAVVQVMVNGNWQDAAMTTGGTSSCAIDQGPGGCTFEFISDLS
jgi:hypothetical protein